MEKTKGAFFSMGIWGGIFAFIPSVVEIIEQVATSGLLGAQATSIVTLVGGLLAIIGRKAATTKIDGLF